jgi:hypothetical protein
MEVASKEEWTSNEEGLVMTMRVTSGSLRARAAEL